MKKKKKYLIFMFCFYLLLSFHFFQERFVLNICEVGLGNIGGVSNLNLSSNFFNLQCNFSNQNTLNNIKKVVINNFSSEVYFCPIDNCEEVLVNLTKQSTNIECALFDLKLENFIFALESKNTLLFLDELNLNHFEEYASKKYWINRLKTDEEKSASHLMHNKFCIFENKTIFTGSFNPTENGAFKNDNNLVVIHSEEIAETYSQQFENLWFYKNGDVTNRYFLINKSGKQYFFNTYFCPQNNCDENVAEFLSGSEESIKFMTFSFTDDLIGDSIVNNSQDISVKGIFESKGTTTEYSEYSKLNNKYPGVLKDENKYNMHHKFFIIDNSILITGSYNPTWNGANRNDENIIVTNYPELVEEFVDYFDDYYRELEK